MKERITITIDKELLDWLDAKVNEKLFASRSHGLELLMKANVEDERKDNNYPGQGIA